MESHKEHAQDLNILMLLALLKIYYKNRLPVNRSGIVCMGQGYQQKYFMPAFTLTGSAYSSINLKYNI